MCSYDASARSVLSRRCTSRDSADALVVRRVARAWLRAEGVQLPDTPRWARLWAIPTDHFDPNVGRRKVMAARKIPLEEVLVENSSYPRGHLKQRLLSTGLKQPVCELCGQGEIWNGRRMSLVLDHIDGVSNDHRLENLRIVCPNCAGTLDTHCGRNLPRQRACPTCQQMFIPKTIRHRYCSQSCWGASAAALYRGRPHPESRKVERPSHEQLRADIASMSFVAIGRKYGVSDYAIRKWLRWYEQEAERALSDAVERDAA